MPVTVVPTSLATVAMDTFITELSSVIRNWPAARVTRTMAVALRSTRAVTTQNSPRSRSGSAVHEVGAEVGGQQVLRSRVAAHLDHSSHETGPARLVAGPEPGAVVAVEVLVELQHVLPVGIALEALGPAVHRPAAVDIGNEDHGQSPAQLGGHLEQGAVSPRAGGALHLEVVAVV